jgi:DNA polymerase-3 subunit alpha
MCLLVISEFQNKNPREIALIGLKHINLKEASDAIRQQFGEKQTATVSKQSFQKKKYWLIQTLCIYIYTFSVLQSTISIPQLVKAFKKNACSCHDRSRT